MNLQNIPRDQLDVKRAFIPKLDMFLFADYKAIEPRLVAEYLFRLGNPRMLNDFMGDIDPYTSLWWDMFPDKKVDRHKAKVLFLSQLYGGGIPTLTRQLGCDRTTAAGYLRAYKKARPEIVDLRKRLDKTLSNKGYITNHYGRRLYPDSPHKALNYLIQSTAADMLGDAFIELHCSLQSNDCKSHIVNLIHDEIILDVSSDEYSIVRNTVIFIMTNQNDFSVPIEVEIKEANNWAGKG